MLEPDTKNKILSKLPRLIALHSPHTPRATEAVCISRVHRAEVDESMARALYMGYSERRASWQRTLTKGKGLVGLTLGKKQKETFRISDSDV